MIIPGRVYQASRAMWVCPHCDVAWVHDRLCFICGRVGVVGVMEPRIGDRSRLASQPV